MLKYLFVFILSLGCLIIHGQVQVEATPTGRHAKALKQAKEAREETKRRKQQAKETKKKVKQHKKAKKLYNEKYDSLRAQRMDSLNIELFSEEDSLAISEEILEQTNFPDEYDKLIREPPILFDSTDIQGVDSLAIGKAESVGESKAREYLPEELAAPDDPLESLTDPASGLSKSDTNLDQPGIGVPSVKKPSKPNPNLVKPDQAKELFNKVDPKQFASAQAEMEKLKKKYSELPDTRYPEEGTKRNSLEDTPLKQRLYVGGIVSLQSTDPLILSANLQLGYWVNKKWMTGVGLTLREQFNQEDTSSLVTGDGYGFSLFTRYDIPKGFFAWAESEWQINRSFFGQEGTSATTEWQQAYLVGVGRDFKIGKVRMMSMVLYDFNYRNNDLNPRPLVFKMGFQLSKKP